MNGTQVTNTLTPIVSFIAGILAVKFTMFDAVTWSSILMGAVGLGATIWGAFSTRNRAVITQAAALPEVNRVLTDSATAQAIPASNVVAGQ
jgi:hypothetical protein